MGLNKNPSPDAIRLAALDAAVVTALSIGSATINAAASVLYFRSCAGGVKHPSAGAAVSPTFRFFIS